MNGYELSSNANGFMVCATLIVRPNMFGSIDFTYGYKRVFTTSTHIRQPFKDGLQLHEVISWPNSYEYEKTFLFTLLFLDYIEIYK